MIHIIDFPNLKQHFLTNTNHYGFIYLKQPVLYFSSFLSKFTQTPIK